MIILEQFILPHELHVELTLIELDDLSHALFDPHLLNVVILIGCVHHCWHIVHVFLLSHASVHTHIAITEGVYFEGYLKSAIWSQILNCSREKKVTVLMESFKR